jgi:hypothetical protein
MVATHTEWQYAVCPVCGYLDEEVSHDFDRQPEVTHRVGHGGGEPRPDLGDLVGDYSSREHLREGGFSSSYGTSPGTRFRKDVADGWVEGESIPAGEVWSKRAAPPPPPPPASERPIHVPDAEEEAMAILGFTEGMSKKQMRTRFRKLLKENHPDVSHHPDATQRTIAIHDAYSLLKARSVVN